MKVSVYGIGKAGLPLAAVIADKGLKVIGVGRNPDRTSQLNQGHNPIPEEPGLQELLHKHAGNNLLFTTDGINASKQSTVHIIIVPVFIDKNKKPDFSNIKDAAHKIALGLKKGDVVVLETTVPVGTTNKVIRPILEKYSKLKAGLDFYLAMSPERMMTGYAISRYQEFPKIVGGVNSKSTKRVARFYELFCRRVIKVSNMETAELIKISEGIYRDVNISLANELYQVSQRHNLDYWEIKQAANNVFCNLHNPGNVGGHCIPVYPWLLINHHTVPLIKKARQLNDKMIYYYADRVAEIAKSGMVLVVGIGFREGVKETAYTRSFPFIKLLKRRGYNVTVYDPLYSQIEIINLGFRYSVDFKNASCIVVMNNYTELKNKLKSYKHKIVDIKNILASQK